MLDQIDWDDKDTLVLGGVWVLRGGCRRRGTALAHPFYTRFGAQRLAHSHMLLIAFLAYLGLYKI